jgi:hypothetical protein
MRYGHHHPPEHLTLNERTMLFYLISQSTAINGGPKTIREISVALSKEPAETGRVLTNLGLRLPLTHRPWRLHRERSGTSPAVWSVRKRVSGGGNELEK